MDSTHGRDNAVDITANGLAELVAKRLAPNSDWTAMGGTDHFVQFYESEEYLVNSIAEYLIHGLRTNETAIAAATREHLNEAERIMRDFGMDVEGSRREGRYVPLEAAETLAKFMRDDEPDPALFDEVIGGLLRRSLKVGRVRVFGEMVGVLLDRGNPAASLQLEELWNGLRETCHFSLFCAYRGGSIANEAAAELMTHVCTAHSRVIPDETYTSLTTAEDRLRAVAFLQHRARRLEKELAELEASLAGRQLVTDLA